MSIFKDMDLIYDLKMLKEGKDSPLKERYLSYIERIDADDRKAFDTFYAPIIEDFYKRDLKGKELAEWKYQRYMRDYAKVVKSLDDNVGRVLDYLKEKDMLDNTLVVYTSDQGFYMGEHGWFDKRFMYEESMHTPLIMHLPKRAGCTWRHYGIGTEHRLWSDHPRSCRYQSAGRYARHFHVAVTQGRASCKLA